MKSIMKGCRKNGRTDGTEAKRMTSAQLPESSVATKILLTALQWPGVGPAGVMRIANALRHGSDSASLVEVAEKALGEKKIPSRDYRLSAESGAAKILEQCQSHAIRVLSVLDSDYPDELRTIVDAPPLIYMRGNLNALKPIKVAVVGTREASDSGKKIAHRIGEVLAANDITTVSGLALGIDTAAHAGALAGGGPTIAILAHGLHMVAPASNRDLADKILDAGGALMSEHAPGVPPRRPEFVRRNRIQSGISMGSIVVESGAKGGAIHQASFTKKQGRILFSVLPPAQYLSRSQFNRSGADHLISEYGAIPIANAMELIEHFFLHQPTVLTEGSEDMSQQQHVFNFIS